MYALQGKTRPTRHTLSKLSPCMPLGHTYLTWSTYNNLLWVINRFERIPLLPRKRNTRQHPYHVGWLIYGSPSSFSPPLSQWSSRLNPRLCWWQVARLTGPIYQHTIGKFNTCLWGPTHRSLTDTCRGYNLGGASFAHTTPQPSHLAVSTLHLRALPGLELNHIPPINTKFKSEEPMVAMWSPDHSAIYRHLHLRLAIANNLSLTIGFTRIDLKVNLM
jgi:hypothetical protein